MSSITAKSTKAEILEAYKALQDQRTTWADAWALASKTIQSVLRETILLGQDCYKAGRLSRQWVSGIVDELSQPVLRSKA